MPAGPLAGRLLNPEPQSLTTGAPKRRLGVLVTHPIQYYSPWFSYLAKKLDLVVYYTHRQTSEDHAKTDLGVAFDWDRDLLSGYKHNWLQNRGYHREYSRFLRHDTPGIREIVGRSEFDAFLIFGWYYLSAWQTALACRKNGIPVIMRGDSHLRMKRGRLKLTAKSVIYPKLLAQFDAHLFVGTRNREYLKRYGVEDHKLFFAPHFVDTEFFRQASNRSRLNGDRERIRRELGIPQDSFLFCFVGSLIPRKSPQTLLKALTELLETTNEKRVYALFIGDGSSKRKLLELSSRCSQHTRFLGFLNQSDLPKYYQCCDALVLPSTEESWGLVVNEAMACGIPAIVSEHVGCVPDLIDDRLTGFSFPAGDVAALKDRMLRIIALQDNERARVESALSRKTDQFSMSCATNGLLEAIQESKAARFIGSPAVADCK